MKFVLLSLFLCFAPLLAQADLHLEEPASLLIRASQDKNQLRDVINEIDQNLAEMRDGETFDKYFFMLDDLQKLSDTLQLDTIYPDAVKKLGGRMVQKGVNWLNLFHDSKEKILYYHRWMAEPQPAFAFLYSLDLQIKEEKDYASLKVGAENLEAALMYADQKWPNENSLRLLYRDTSSDLSVKILKTTDLSEDEVLFWLTKIYTPESMTDVAIDLQNRVYSMTVDHKTDLHFILKRLIVIHTHILTATFAAPESLISQLGDTVSDLLLKSFRFQEKLSDDEYNGALAMMEKRHFANLANSWTTLEAPPSNDFAAYYIQRAFQFISAMQNMGLKPEAELLSREITQKAGGILAHSYKMEGLWQMVDSKGFKWNLNIIFANDNYLFANLSKNDKRQMSMPLFNVVYDMKLGGFIATRRGVDPDLASNIPVRFFPQEDGTMRVIYLLDPNADKEMIAHKIQSYPDLLTEKRENAPDLNGVYEGTMTFDHGPAEPIRLSVTVINSDVVANLQHPAFMATFNYGNDAHGGVLYITRGNDMVLGFWMHIRAKLDDQGNLDGYLIMGDRGMMPVPLHLKKVRSIQ